MFDCNIIYHYPTGIAIVRYNDAIDDDLVDTIR